MGERRGRGHPGPSDKCLDVLFGQRQLYCDALGSLRGVDTLLNVREMSAGAYCITLE